MAGPLRGLRVVELAGIGPGPHAGMSLADLGADVVRVTRPNSSPIEFGLTSHVLRGRTTVIADLKNDAEAAAVLELIDDADVLLEGYRPGVMERLGLGPDICLGRNPRLIYARMTGWGQSGPLAPAAGHDINFTAITGVLHAIGPAERPVPPLNLIGDYAGGSLYVVTGILAALWERQCSGQGQIIDAAMVDGVSALIQPILELRALGLWNDQRDNNILDGGAPYYRTYECSDGKHIAVGAFEPQFYAELLTGLGLAQMKLPAQNDRAQWSTLASVFASVFRTRTRDEWDANFAGTNACVTPVLSFAEAPDHRHIAARKSQRHHENSVIAAGAPRFSRSVPDDANVGEVIKLAQAVGRWKPHGAPEPPAG